MNLSMKRILWMSLAFWIAASGTFAAEFLDLPNTGGGPASQPVSGDWGQPVRGIAARVLLDRDSYALGQEPIATFELKRVMENAPQSAERRHQDLVLSFPGGGTVAGRHKNEIGDATTVGVGEVFFRARLGLNVSPAFRPWINADGLVCVGCIVDQENGKPVRVESAPVAVRITTDLDGLDKYVGTLVKDGSKDELAQVGRIPDSELHDSPETFLYRLTLHQAVPTPSRQDAGYVYGRRVALKHLAADKPGNYVPTAGFKDAPFVIGFQAGYQAAMAAGKPRSPAKAFHAAVTAGVYAAKIKPVVPKGWALTTEKNVVTIRREQPIEWYGTISLPAHKGNADLKAMGCVHSGTYTIVMEFAPPMTAEESERLEKENKKISRDYLAAHPVHPNEKPTAPPRELTDRLHRIPDILLQDCSVFFKPYIHGSLAFYDDAVGTECKTVESEVRALLSKARSAGNPLEVSFRRETGMTNHGMLSPACPR